MRRPTTSSGDIRDAMAVKPLMSLMSTVTWHSAAWMASAGSVAIWEATCGEKNRLSRSFDTESSDIVRIWETSRWATAVTAMKSCTAKRLAWRLAGHVGPSSEIVG